jgi:hypothetical protein
MLFFNSKDRDRDGRISYEEFCDRETVSERAFKAMDVNGDGFVSKSEMLKASNRGARRWGKVGCFAASAYRARGFCAKYTFLLLDGVFTPKLLLPYVCM